MSMTITMQTTVKNTFEVQLSPLHLQPRHAIVRDIKNELKNLYSDIQTSTLLPFEILPPPESFMNSTTLELGFFLLNIIEPALLYYADDTEAMEKLWVFYETIKNSIEYQIPKEENFDQFLESCQSTINDEIEKEIKKILEKEIKEAQLEKSTQKVFENANALNELNRQQNQAISDYASEINTIRKCAVQQLNERLKSLNKRMQKIYTQTENTTFNLINLCTKIKLEDKKCQDVLKQCKATLGEI